MLFLIFTELSQPGSRLPRSRSRSIIGEPLSRCRSRSSHSLDVVSLRRSPSASTSHELCSFRLRPSSTATTVVQPFASLSIPSRRIQLQSRSTLELPKQRQSERRLSSSTSSSELFSNTTSPSRSTSVSVPASTNELRSVCSTERVWELRRAAAKTRAIPL